MDILSYLANISLNEDAYNILSEAVEEVANEEDPCIGRVLTYLHDLYENRPESMSNRRYEVIGTVERYARDVETKPIIHVAVWGGRPKLSKCWSMINRFRSHDSELESSIIQ